MELHQGSSLRLQGDLAAAKEHAAPLLRIPAPTLEEAVITGRNMSRW